MHTMTTEATSKARARKPFRGHHVFFRAPGNCLRFRAHGLFPSGVGGVALILCLAGSVRLTASAARTVSLPLFGNKSDLAI